MNIMTAWFDQDYVTRMYGIEQRLYFPHMITEIRQSHTA